jgi:hypothetical protein
MIPYFSVYDACRYDNYNIEITVLVASGYSKTGPELIIVSRCAKLIKFAPSCTIWGEYLSFVA